MKVRGVVVVLAFLLAAGATAAVFAYVNGVKHNNTTASGEVSVVVSKQDIPAGTNLDSLISSGAFTTIQVPRDAVVQGAVTNLQQLKGQTTSLPIIANEQIPAARLVGAANLGGGRLGIPKGMEAITLTLDPQNLVGNAIEQGDHVTIYGSFELNSTVSGNGQVAGNNAVVPGLHGNVSFSSSGINGIVSTVVPDVLVLQGPSAGATQGATPGQITLALKPSDAEKVVFTQENGKAWLALQPPGQKGVQTHATNLVGVLK